MKKLLAISLSLLSITQLQATKFDRAHTNISKALIAALGDSNEYDVTVDETKETLECYAPYRKDQYLTTFKLRDMKEAFLHGMHRKSKKIRKFCRGKDLPIDTAALAPDHKIDIINTRNAIVDSLLAEDIRKLAAACESLRDLEGSWYGVED